MDKFESVYIVEKNVKYSKYIKHTSIIFQDKKGIHTKIS